MKSTVFWPVCLFRESIHGITESDDSLPGLSVGLTWGSSEKSRGIGPAHRDSDVVMGCGLVWGFYKLPK